MTYGEHEHRHAMERLLRDIGLPIGLPLQKPCPECPELMEWFQGESAEDGMCRYATPPGYYCICGAREVRVAA